jgi:hypothetical protein
MGLSAPFIADDGQTYSMTLSARTRIEFGTVMPMALAAFMLISSNLVLTFASNDFMVADYCRADGALRRIDQVQA